MFYPPSLRASAKQSMERQERKVDCFVASAPRNDALRHTFAFPRRDPPEVCKEISLPSPKRGRRESRMRAAPAVSCAKLCKKHAHEHTGPAEAIRLSPRNGFNGL